MGGKDNLVPVVEGPGISVVAVTALVFLGSTGLWCAGNPRDASSLEASPAVTHFPMHLVQSPTYQAVSVVGLEVPPNG